MKIKIFLTINSNGSVRVTKKYPDLAWNEVTIAQTINLPDRLFEKPALEATITVPEDAARPAIVLAEVEDNIREAIETVTGMSVTIKISDPDES